MREGIIFILSGPSGGGKTSLAKIALERHENISFSVSYTTRPPRKGEVDGKDYKFVSEAEFAVMLNEDRFVEYAKVHNNLYGTPVSEFDRARSTGVDLILDIDVQGARQIRKNYKSAVLCFILPHTFKILSERLRQRGSEKDVELDRRLSEVKREMEDLIEYDYIIVNDDMDNAAEKLSSIIISTRCEAARISETVKREFFSEESE